MVLELIYKIESEMIPISAEPHKQRLSLYWYILHKVNSNFNALK